VRGAEQRTGMSRKFCEYTYSKSIDPLFHPQTVGGARHNLLNDDQQPWAENLLWLEVQLNPARNQPEFASALRALGVPINTGWVKRVFARWRFTCKKVHWRSPNKYSNANILFYIGFSTWLPHIDPRRIKFADESSFMRRGKTRPCV